MTPSELPLPTPPLAEIFWEEHRQKILLIIGSLLLLVVLVGSILFFQYSRRQAANALLAQATGMEEWQKIVQRYPNSGATADALLLMAAAERDQHHLDKSNALYSQFLEKFSHHPLAISGLIGRAINDDIAGNPQQAISEYQQAASAYPKSYGAPFALMSEARILTRQGKTVEVKRILSTISTQYPDSLVTTMMKRGAIK